MVTYLRPLFKIFLTRPVVAYPHIKEHFLFREQRHIRFSHGPQQDSFAENKSILILIIQRDDDGQSQQARHSVIIDDDVLPPYLK